MIWLKFAAIQLVQLAAAIIGWALLAPACLMQAWAPGARSTKDGRPIDYWRWGWLDAIYGNPEDGVSGQQALVWIDGKQAPYMPGAWAPLRAYCWSALRNSCDALKYRFADATGPLITWNCGWCKGKAGWQMENGLNVPVLSVHLWAAR